MPPPRQPWPMKYIVIAILAFVVIYTFITLRFRKSGPAYQPYHDMKERAVVARLKSAGYQRLAATVVRPAEVSKLALSLQGPDAADADEAGGLPAELKQTLIDQPKLPQTFSDLHAPAQLNPAQPYQIQFTCNLGGNKLLLADTYVYVRDDEVLIVPDFEPISGELLARTESSIERLTIPGGAFTPGTYHVTLLGAKQSKQWTLQVH